MNTKTFVLALAMGSLMVGCKDKGGDSGETGGATNACGTDGTDGTDGGDGGSSVDACDWTGLDLCIEFDGYSDTESWCSGIASTYGIDTAYGAECADGAVGQCDVTSAGGDYPSGASSITAFYYEPSFDASSAADSCASAGGSK